MGETRRGGSGNRRSGVARIEKGEIGQVGARRNEGEVGDESLEEEGGSPSGATSRSLHLNPSSTPKTWSSLPAPTPPSARIFLPPQAPTPLARAPAWRGAPQRPRTARSAPTCLQPHQLAVGARWGGGCARSAIFSPLSVLLERMAEGGAGGPWRKKTAALGGFVGSQRRV